MAEPAGAPVPRVRSQLYVPGNRPDRMGKALTLEADALVVDLEDSVAAADKARARDWVSDFVADHHHERPLFVRVAGSDHAAFLADVTAAVQAGASGIVIPKVTGPADVQVADRLLGWLEELHNVPIGRTLITPILETARGIRQAYAIGCASPRVAYMGGLAPKGGDVQGAIGYRWSRAGWESLPLRAQVLLDARAAGVSNPLTGLWTEIDDLDGLEAFAEQSRALGYAGMTVIHPSHLSIVNRIFGQSAEELEHYRTLVEAVTAAEATGSAVTVVGGHMVDTAMLETARAELAQAAVAEDASTRGAATPKSAASDHEEGLE